MRVAVVTVRSAAETSGGAERFYDALVESFKQMGHDAEEVVAPGDESTFEKIVDNYLHCYDLNLSRYDLVVSTKAPTWMVRHPRHVCYLVHTIRVFYDMFDATFPKPTSAHRQQRELVHRMDTLALAAPHCRGIFSIGGEVAQRLARWNGLQTCVLHPPLWTDAFHTGASGNYLYLPGRLHAWKRVDLVIRAMKHVKSPVRLVISGTGEAEQELRATAGNDPRIEFRGRVTDAELIELYAHAFAVPFAPMREDYGYITLEAFASGKPVITCRDSGEAASIVQHGVSGYVCEADPRDFARHIELLWGNRAQAAAFGEEGMNWVSALSWSKIAEKLIETAGA